MYSKNVWKTYSNDELEKQKKLQMDEHLKKVNDELPVLYFDVMRRVYTTLEKIMAQP